MDPNSQPKKQPASKSELLSSAKVVAGAAKASLSHGSAAVDKGKVAGAGANLIGAAAKYGKLDGKAGVGKYVDKAETYLHQYHTSHSHSAPATANPQYPPHHSAPATAYPQYPPHHSAPATANPQYPPQSASNDGGKYGNYVKLAQGFLKKY